MYYAGLFLEFLLSDPSPEIIVKICIFQNYQIILIFLGIKKAKIKLSITESVGVECILSRKLEVCFAWARRLLGVTGAGLVDSNLIGGC